MATRMTSWPTGLTLEFLRTTLAALEQEEAAREQKYNEMQTTLWILRDQGHLSFKQYCELDGQLDDAENAFNEWYEAESTLLKTLLTHCEQLAAQ